ncbi:chromosome 12 open reading frame 50 [Plakobranchus ocellatus]|uniref:Chromosome 12 open reading frame 50 n=1 Tax=Plakobranchus ocellatus TaxID=259542 RepID=A0AAV4D5Q1_9GAST|nr:chromosome 12 open reading frame 50 [Plakobranchus ocellatus]
MSTLGDDCYYFCTSACIRGPACQFRHVEAAKTCKIICQHWQMGNCLRPMCKFRHSTFPIPTSTADTPCYWETQPIGCSKKTCPYKHLKPRPDSQSVTDDKQPSTIAPSGSSSSSGPSPVVTQVQNSQQSKGEDSDNKISLKSESETTAAIENFPSQNITAISDDKTLKSEDNENSNKENGKKPTEQNNEKPAVIKSTTKKVVKKTGVKKKATGSAVKKTKVVKKVPVKVKKQVAKEAIPEGVKTTEKALKPQRNIKERLGIALSKKKPVTAVAPDEDESSSASEGKPLAPTEPKKTTKPPPAPAEIVTKKAVTKGKILQKKKAPSSLAAGPVKTKKVIPVAVAKRSEEESSSSSSDSSSSEGSGDSEPDVRRVVVEDNDEIAARKRAKASLLKKQRGILGQVQSGKVVKAKDRIGSQVALKDLQFKRRMVNVDYDSDDIVSSRMRTTLNVRDRLGKPPTDHAVSSSKLTEITRKAELSNSPRKAVLVQSRLDKEASSTEDDDDDFLEGVRVKTLDEIRREKMQKSMGGAQEKDVDSTGSGEGRVLSVQQRLGISSPRKQQDTDEDVKGGRQVLISNDNGSKSDESSNVKTSVEEKKAKRRPWRSKKRIVIDGKGEQTAEQDDDGDERTAVVMSPVTAEGDNPGSAGCEVDESPFARLKRRALQKKLQSLQQKKGSLPIKNIVKEPISEEPQDIAGNVEVKLEQEESEGQEEPAKKHKHKHKHKHNKKSKRERQIYMPPALKSTAPQELAISPPRDEHVPALVTAAPTIKIAPQRRAGPHPIAAAWAAGLNVSAKGTARLPPPTKPAVSVSQQVGVTGRLSLRPGLSAPPEPVKKSVSLSNSQSTSDPTGAVIKSFSEIMAEKKRRRLEMQASKSGDPPSTSFSASLGTADSAKQTSSFSNNSPVKSNDAIPRASITPIVFNTEKQSPLKLKSHPQLSVPTLPSSQHTHIPQQAVSPAPTVAQSTSSISLPSSSTFPIIPQNITSLPSSLPTEQPNSRLTTPLIEKQSLAKTTSSKKGAGQKKLFKKKTPIKQPTAPEENSVTSMASLGISIPLPPMTLEEELLLDEGPSASLLKVTDTKSNPDGFGGGRFELDLSSAALEKNSSQELDKEVDPHFGSQEQEHISSAGSGASHTLAKSSPSPGVATATVQKRPSSDGAQPTVKKSRLSIDDELALFDEDIEDFASNSDVVAGSTMEPIDDLLQNIDDLLA